MRKAQPATQVPVVVMGLGFIGREIVRAVQGSPELQLVAAVDSNPQMIGKKLGELIGDPTLKVPVTGQLEQALRSCRGGVLLHATGSRLPQVMDQLLSGIRAGLSVVSTCEELAFPYLKYPRLAEKLDEAAEKAGVCVLGIGVNPGYVLDRLVATGAQVCGEVRRIDAKRVVDARTRREALQRKVGAGLSEKEFSLLVEKEQIGHVGLAESAALCALGSGISCDQFEEEIEPVLAREDIQGGAFPVLKGRVAGISQTAVGYDDGRERVRLELTIAVGAQDPGDRILIEGDPPLEMEIKGGVAGDRATAHLVVNAAPRVTAAEAGLLTVLELPAGR